MPVNPVPKPWRTQAHTMLDWIDRGLDRCEKGVLIGAIATMASVSVANVGLRNLSGASLLWANEINQLLLVVVTFMGLGLGARQARHIRVSAIHDLLARPARKALLIITSFVTAGLLFALAAWALDYADSTRRSCRILPETLDLAGLSLPLGSLPPAASLALMVLAMVLIGQLAGSTATAGRKLRSSLPGWLRAGTIVAISLGLILVLWWLGGLAADLIANRSGRCRVMSATGLPVYLVHLVVPLGLTLGALQFALAGLRNLASRGNYLSWREPDEYLDEQGERSSG
ncbi:MAG: TRAP transporter small permease [Wenzhouxiangella sp.]